MYDDHHSLRTAQPASFVWCSPFNTVVGPPSAATAVSSLLKKLPSLQHVVLLLVARQNTDPVDNCEQASTFLLQIAQSAAASRETQFTVVLSHDDLILQHSVLGMIRVIQTEYRTAAWRTVVTDQLQSDAATWEWVARFPNSALSKNEEVIIDGDKVKVKCFAKVTLPSMPKMLKTQGGACVIFGGTSGLGLELGIYLSQQKLFVCILLATRSCRPTRDITEEIYTPLVFDVCDITKESDVEATIAKAESRAGSVACVIHSAMVLNDAMIATLDEKKVRTVLEPKTRGSWNIHLALSKSPARSSALLFLFSSTTAFFGNPGQFAYGGGNGFLDGLCAFRKSQNLLCVCINWGAFSQIGYLSANSDVENILKRRGIGGINRAEFFSSL